MCLVRCVGFSLFLTLRCSVLTEEEWRLRLAAAPPAHQETRSDAQPAAAPASASRSTAPTSCAPKPNPKRLQIITASSCYISIHQPFAMCSPIFFLLSGRWHCSQGAGRGALARRPLYFFNGISSSTRCFRCLVAVHVLIFAVPHPQRCFCLSVLPLTCVGIGHAGPKTQRRP